MEYTPVGYNFTWILVSIAILLGKIVTCFVYYLRSSGLGNNNVCIVQEAWVKKERHQKFDFRGYPRQLLMVGDGLRDLCDWRLEVGHDENCVTYADFSSE